MKRLILMLAVIGAPATAQVQTTCRQVFNTVQCMSYDQTPPAVSMQAVPNVGGMMLQQMMAPRTPYVQPRQYDGDLARQAQQIENCRYAAAHGFAC